MEKKNMQGNYDEYNIYTQIYTKASNWIFSDR